MEAGTMEHMHSICLASIVSTDSAASLGKMERGTKDIGRTGSNTVRDASPTKMVSIESASGPKAFD